MSVLSLAVDHCSGAPCLHGKCKVIHNNYECCCDAGWTGTNCDIGPYFIVCSLILYALLLHDFLYCGMVRN